MKLAPALTPALEQVDISTSPFSKSFDILHNRSQSCQTRAKDARPNQTLRLDFECPATSILNLLRSSFHCRVRLEIQGNQVWGDFYMK